MRGATQGGPVLAVPERISIHAPHAGRDVILNPIPQEVALFQSTRPMRGATISLTLRRSAALYFNPRAPCGRDGLYGYSRYLLPEFQSTRPVRARLQLRQELHAAKQISIHAPRAGATLQKPTSYFHITISIHAPRAGATKSGSPPCYTDSISIHAPRAGATRRIDGVYRRVYISIHAPRAGATRDHTLHGRIRANFNPRAPCGRDPLTSFVLLSRFNFNPRAPCGRDARNDVEHCPPKNFNPRAPCGRDHGYHSFRRGTEYFNPRAPCGRDSKSIQNYFTHFCDKRQFLDNFTQNAAF